jgi:hypothetical protein
MKKVAVQNGLNTISDYLCSEGYTVTEFDNRKKNAGNFYNKYDAVVVTGENQNVMGIEDSSSTSTIINATGMTAQEIKARIEESNRK